jgi:hypothetical protein
MKIAWMGGVSLLFFAGTAVGAQPQFWMADHYRWIYRQLLEAGYQIGPIVQKNGLILGAERPAAHLH